MLSLNYAFNPIAEQALGSNQAIMPQRVNAALELMTKLPAICCILIALLSSSAGATCIDQPFDEQLKAADAVFVATLVSGRVVEKPEELKDKGWYVAEYTFVVREVLKGSPLNTNSIYTVGMYDDPTDGRIFHYAEATRLRLGQSVLVLANGSENVQVSLCSGSRLVTTEVLREAKRVLGSGSKGT